MYYRNIVKRIPKKFISSQEYEYSFSCLGIVENNLLSWCSDVRASHRNFHKIKYSLNLSALICRHARQTASNRYIWDVKLISHWVCKRRYWLLQMLKNKIIFYIYTYMYILYCTFSSESKLARSKPVCTFGVNMAFTIYSFILIILSSQGKQNTFLKFGHLSQGHSSQ